MGLTFKATLVASFLALVVPVSAGEVVLTKGKQSVKAVIDGQAFLAYQTDPARPKPFFLPVTAPGGFEVMAAQLAEPKAADVPAGNVFVVQEDAAVLASPDSSEVIARVPFGTTLAVSKLDKDAVYVDQVKGWLSKADVVPYISTITRYIDDAPQTVKRDRKDPLYYDHPHHKGIWFSIDEINEIKYWAEKGKIVNHSLELTTPKGLAAVMTVINHWVDDAGKPVLEETAVVTIHDNRLIDYRSTLKAVSGHVTFGHTKEGMFAVRVPNSMREFIGNGPVVSDAGITGTQALWGKPTPWIDYQGPINGVRYGVTVMDHPGNFRPSRYHVRDYGLFAISPFGDPDYTNGEVKTPPFELPQGGSVTLRYGVYPHTGDAASAGVADVFKQFSTGK